MTAPDPGVGPPVLSLALSPFGASAAAMVELARVAEDTGLAGVWTFDHLSGSMLGRGWSHDPFAVLGAMAVSTSGLVLGPLVANMMNRHPVQLALALATLQSLSGGRAVLGIGAGASPGSRFAAEHDAIGTRLLPAAARRRRLVETIELIDALWRGDDVHLGDHVSVEGIGDVVGPVPRPPIIVGANGPAMVDLALGAADGVNLNAGSDVAALAARIGAARPSGFPTSVLVDPGPAGVGGIDLAPWLDLPGVDEVILVAGPTCGRDDIVAAARRAAAAGPASHPLLRPAGTAGRPADPTAGDDHPDTLLSV